MGTNASSLWDAARLASRRPLHKPVSFIDRDPTISDLSPRQKSGVSGGYSPSDKACQRCGYHVCSCTGPYDYAPLPPPPPLSEVERATAARMQAAYASTFMAKHKSTRREQQREQVSTITAALVDEFAGFIKKRE